MMKVKCERDGTVFEVQPRMYPSSEYPWKKEFCKEEGYTYPCRVIYCPTCGRGYFHEVDGRWMSDRPLTIIEDEEE